MAKPNPTGGSFAERAAAREGKSSFTDPTPDATAPQENTTFAERAKTSSKKQVDGGDAEDKAVKSSATKSRRK